MTPGLLLPSSSSPLAFDHSCPHALRQLAQPVEIYFQERYEKSAAPFLWTFIREDLAKLMIRLNAKALAPAA